MTTFWKDNIQILFNGTTLLEIFPSKHYDLNRKMNAIVRLSFYYTVIVYLYNRNSKVLLTPFIVMGLTCLIHYKKGEDVIFTDKLEDYISENDNNMKCRISTKDNPFMNNTLTDYGKPAVDKACPSYNNVGIQKRVDELFNEDLYRDVNDIFNKNNSQRQYYTVPGNQVPNDQGSFANWLYGTPSTCKEGNQIACLSQMGRGSSNSNKD